MSEITHIPHGASVTHLSISDETMARVRRECIEDAANPDPLISAAAKRLHLAIIEAQIMRGSMAVIVTVADGTALEP